MFFEFIACLQRFFLGVGGRAAYTNAYVLTCSLSTDVQHGLTSLFSLAWSPWPTVTVSILCWLRPLWSLSVLLCIVLYYYHS